MCGRFVLRAPPQTVREVFGYEQAPNFPARYNIAPTQPIAIVRSSREGPEFALVRWGLVPSWVKDLKGFPTIINARSEEAAGKPAFRNAIRRRRCLVPADGFYEWQKTANGKKQPYLIERPGSEVFAFAGLWESWMDADGNELESAAILTTAANETLKPLHHRMPVVVARADHARWLDMSGENPDDIADLLRPAPDDFFRAFPVSTRVNAVSNDDEGLLAPVADTATPASQPRARKAGRKRDPDDGQMSLL